MLIRDKPIEGFVDLVKRVNELQHVQDFLIVIGGGMLQYVTFIETANMGLGVILIDGDENCYCRILANHFIKVSTREPYKILYKVKQFLVEHPTIKVVGVYTQGTDVEFSVACLAQDLKLPGISPKVARVCNNKVEMRLIFAQNYIPQPIFGYTEDLETAKSIAKRLGFPCVFKPVDNCGSRGLTIVKEENQIDMAFQTALRNSIEQRVLIEQFIEGNEYSVDTIVYGGKLYPAGISDREFTKVEGYAIQTGSLTPSLLPTDKQEEIYDLMEKVAKVIGVDNSAFKGDIIIDTSGKVMILEVTARLSGGFDSQYRKPLSYGINLIKATIELAMGEPLNFSFLIPKWVKWSKTFHIFPKSGVIKDIKGLDDRGHIKDVKGIRKIFWTKTIGDRVEDYKHCADRIVHIIGYADTLEQLQQVESNVKNTLQVITE